VEVAVDASAHRLEQALNAAALGPSGGMWSGASKVFAANEATAEEWSGLARTAALRSDARERGPSMSTKRVPTKRYRSASTLAGAFGSGVIEPTWWPEDATKIAYRLDHRLPGAGYSMLAIRRGGVPVGVVAHPEHPGAGLLTVTGVRRRSWKGSAA
jgi:hypothetical protein